jgi:hypothetical protein
MKTYNEPVPVSIAMETDPELREIVEKIGRGEISLCAPFPGMDKPWPEEKKRELAEALSRFGWK